MVVYFESIFSYFKYFDKSLFIPNKADQKEPTLIVELGLQCGVTT